MKAPGSAEAIREAVIVALVGGIIIGVLLCQLVNMDWGGSVLWCGTDEPRK